MGERAINPKFNVQDKYNKVNIINPYRFRGDSAYIPETNLTNAYSLRKIVSSYSGNCIKVRRSSDDTTQDIGFVGDVLDTASLLSFVGASNGHIDTWYDQSTNVNDVSQSTFGKQPFIVSGGTLETDNGNTSILFPGTLVSSGLIETQSNQDYTYFVVGSVDTLSFSKVMWDGDNNASTRRVGQFVRIEGATPWHVGFENNTTAKIDSDSNISINTQYLFVGERTATNLQIYVNNSTDGGLTINSTTNASKSCIVTVGEFNQTGGLNHNGYISEIIHYKDDKSADRTDIQDNINGYYSIY